MNPGDRSQPVAAGITVDAVSLLARKYETLATLRREHAREGKVADRAVLRALAREFPGALRELDTLPEDEIARRQVALARALDEPHLAPPWIAYMARYHQVMRAALFVKARLLRGSGPLHSARAEELARLSSAYAATPVDERFVRAVHSPLDGRLNRVVFDHLAELFGVSAEEIWQTLFPARRRGRY